jgi:hypothetical protein
MRSTTSSKRRPSRPSTPSGQSFKRRKHPPLANQRQYPVRGPALPPILLPSPSFSSHQVPDFPTIPPISTIASIAGSGCTCGLHCACPGCVEHRGEEHASKDRSECSSSCGDCVDWQGGIELPVATLFPAINGQSTSIINQFFARAAALPLPPQNRYRTSSVDVDPMNVIVYPADLFSNHDTIGTSNATTDKRAGAFDKEEREAAFGLVKVPKLECCGGRCGCPEDGCGCGKSCSGRCGEHGDRRRSVSTLAESVGSNGQTSPQIITPIAITSRSCCATKQLI